MCFSDLILVVLAVLSQKKLAAAGCRAHLGLKQQQKEKIKRVYLTRKSKS